MHAVYSLLTGPLAWAAFGIFFGGIIYQLVSRALLARRRDTAVFEYWSFYYALRSILHWICPFASVNSRRHPMLTVVTFVFHVALLAAPLFLFAHISMIYEAFGVRWWFMPDAVADVLTVLVLAACIFFAVRRRVRPEVAYLTTGADYVILALVAAPFLSGFWAYHQLPGHSVATLLHIFSGEVLLAAIPFTRLSHMFFFPFTRGYMGSEFGAVRFARDW